MDARLFSNHLYDKLFDGGEQEEGIVSYSCVPLEIAYIEHLRKIPSIQTNQLKRFCENLNVTRISLSSSDVAQAIEDDELRDYFFNSHVIWRKRSMLGQHKELINA